MSKPTILADTRDEAEPRIRQAADWLSGQFVEATLHRFYACEPCEHQVWNACDPEQHWIEGQWGAEILTVDHLSWSQFHNLADKFARHFDELIEIVDVDIYAEANFKLKLTFTLTARLADEEDEVIPSLCPDCGRMAEVIEMELGIEFYLCGHCGTEWPCEEETDHA